MNKRISRSESIEGKKIWSSVNKAASSCPTWVRSQVLDAAESAAQRVQILENCVMYNLRRESDGAGDSGGMSLALWLEDGEVKFSHEARPVVGVAMRVGSPISRSYSTQDWWQTSMIIEILEESENYVRFRTRNSVYEWWEQV